MIYYVCITLFNTYTRDTHYASVPTSIILFMTTHYTSKLLFMKVTRNIVNMPLEVSGICLKNNEVTIATYDTKLKYTMKMFRFFWNLCIIIIITLQRQCKLQGYKSHGLQSISLRETAVVATFMQYTTSKSLTH